MTDTLVEYESWNGELFTLIGPGKGDRGVWLADEDIENFVEGPIETIYNSHAFQRGASYGGDRIPPREIVVSFEILGTSSGSFEENYSEFRKALSTRKNSKLWVETPNSRRWLTVRLRENPRLVADRDPGRRQYARLVVTFIAADPYWYEPMETASWVSEVDTTSTGTSSGVLPISNPTPEPIWVKYVVQAYAGAIYTLPDFSFGNDRHEMAVPHASRVIDLPALLTGEHLLVDTDEATTQVESNLDTAVYARMDGKRFLYPIPAYTPVTDLPVMVKKAPAGVGVQVYMPRPWPTAWGMQ